MERLFGDTGYVTRLRRSVFKTYEVALFGLVITILLLVGTQVFTRYVLAESVAWTEELSRMLLVWLAMLGAAVALERNEHYVISLIYDRLPPTIKTAVLAATNVLALVFLAVLVIYGWDYFERGISKQYIIVGVSRGWVFVALPVAAASMMFSIVSQTLQAVCETRRTTGASRAGSAAE